MLMSLSPHFVNDIVTKFEQLAPGLHDICQCFIVKIISDTLPLSLWLCACLELDKPVIGFNIKNAWNY